MLINGKHHHTVWYNEELDIVQVFDQRYFPHEVNVFDLKTSQDAFLCN